VTRGIIKVISADDGVSGVGMTLVAGSRGLSPINQHQDQDSQDRYRLQDTFKAEENTLLPLQLYSIYHHNECT